MLATSPGRIPVSIRDCCKVALGLAGLNPVRVLFRDRIASNNIFLKVEVEENLWLIGI